MRPSIALSNHRQELLALSAKHRVRNLRIFGSIVSGQDRDGSDLDLLVDAIPDVTSLLDLSQLGLEAEELLGVPVDIRTPEDIHESFRSRVLAEAKPL